VHVLLLGTVIARWAVIPYCHGLRTGLVMIPMAVLARNAADTGTGNGTATGDGEGSAYGSQYCGAGDRAAIRLVLIRQ
jgi:hypothetical protein